MELEDLKKYMETVWSAYIMCRDGVDLATARSQVNINLGTLEGVEDELDYLRVAFDEMEDACDDTLKKRFYGKFVNIWDEVNYLKTQYERDRKKD